MSYIRPTAPLFFVNTSFRQAQEEASLLRRHLIHQRSRTLRVHCSQTVPVNRPLAVPSSNQLGRLASLSVKNYERFLTDSCDCLDMGSLLGSAWARLRPDHRPPDDLYNLPLTEKKGLKKKKCWSLSSSSSRFVSIVFSSYSETVYFSGKNFGKKTRRSALSSLSWKKAMTLRTLNSVHKEVQHKSTVLMAKRLLPDLE